MNNIEFEESLGAEIAADALANEMAKAVCRALRSDAYPYARLLRARRNAAGTVETLIFEVDVERPQRRAAPIARTELVSATFGGDRQPEVYALRDGFPAASVHINLGSENDPPWLCLEERTWEEVKARWTGFNFIERVRWWLAATARGDLHGEAQPPEPIFVTRLTAIVPPSLFNGRWNNTKTLNIAFVSTESEPNTIVLQEGTPKEGPDGSQFVPIIVTADPQPIQRLRFAPKNIESLHMLLSGWGIDLIEILRREARDILQNRKPQLNTRPLILVFMPLLDAHGAPTGGTDLKAFTIGGEFDFAKLGVELGIFFSSPIVGKQNNIVLRVPANLAALGKDISTYIVSVQLQFDREAAARGAGFSADETNSVIVGAGAIGSHFVEILRRDGFGRWTIIDHDAFLPHNVQRHRVGVPRVGASKAHATAELLNWVIGSEDETAYVVANVLRQPELVAAPLKGATLIIDASASIPVARYLSDMEGAHAPRSSVFFNVAGRDVVLLGEDQDRSISLDALEAQYYRAVIETPELANHISQGATKYQYATACRSVSFQMPESQVAMLSGAIAGEFQEYLDIDESVIAIWTGSKRGLHRHMVRPADVLRHQLADWRVVLDKDIVATLSRLREENLPAETGGILLGTIDIPRKQICVVSVVAAPADSFGDGEGFERGILHLKTKVDDANSKTAGQVEYIGEWHSHPKGVAPKPSRTDISQLVWLGLERALEDVPTLMIIAGDDGVYGVNLAKLA